MPNSFTPQQIEQFLQEFFDVVGARQYIGARYVPIFGRAGEDTVEWDDGAPYEPLTVVMHQGVSYVSRRYVPAGIQITETDYWVETYRFNAQVEQYRQEVLGFQSQIDSVRETMESDYVPFPDATAYPKYGVLGQVLTTLSDGSTKWEDPVVPSDQQAEEIISNWLDDHPEATTTVQDGSITDAKMNGNSFYSKVYMPRTVPNGTTELKTIKTSGTYKIASLSSFTDTPSGAGSGVATLIVLSESLNGSFTTQFLMISTTRTWIRIISNGSSDTVYYDWHQYLTADEQFDLNAHALRNRTAPIGSTHIYQLNQIGIYNLDNALSYDDMPSDFGSNNATVVTYEPCFGGGYILQYLYRSDARTYMRMYNTQTNRGNWLIINNDANNTYMTRARDSAVSTLNTLVSPGAYQNILKVSYTDWPSSDATTGSLFVVDKAMNSGNYAVQYLLMMNQELWVRIINKNTYGVQVDWAMIGNVYAGNDQTLRGKKWAVCGDSFSVGDYTHWDGDDKTIEEIGPYHGYTANYAYLIGNRTGAYVRMRAVSGMTLATPADASSSNCFTNVNNSSNYTNLGSDCDYITLYFGINDSHQSASIPLGTIADTSINTFYGAYNTVLEYLIEHHPTAHIGIIVTNGADTDDYRQATIAVANKWGIPYIDLNGDERTPMMLRSTNPNITSAAKTARLNQQRISSTDWHPNPGAHRYESTFIEQFLKSI